MPRASKKPTPVAAPAKSSKWEAGVEIAQDLKYRLLGATGASNALITDDMIKAVAWFYCYSGHDEEVMAGVLDELGLVKQGHPMGGWTLRRAA